MFQLSISLVSINPFIKRVSQDTYHPHNVCVSVSGRGIQATDVLLFETECMFVQWQVVIDATYKAGLLLSVLYTKSGLFQLLSFTMAGDTGVHKTVLILQFHINTTKCKNA